MCPAVLISRGTKVTGSQDSWVGKILPLCELNSWLQRPMSLIQGLSQAEELLARPDPGP